MRYIMLEVLLAMMFVQGAWGQKTRHQIFKQPYTAHGIMEKSESASRKLDTLFAMSHNIETVRPDSMSNPYYASLMGLPSLYPSMMSRLFALPEGDGCLYKPEGLTYDIRSLLAYTDRYVTDACIFYPDNVLSYENGGMPSEGTPLIPDNRPDMTISQRFSQPKTDEKNVGIPFQSKDDDDLGIVVRRPNFWTFKTNFSLQFTQNYVSDNWYKGGESHNALLASTVIEANFNNQRKLTFDNKLEMKLGFQTSHNDEEHKYKTNSDLIRLTNKLGLRAVRHWYYTVMLQSWTQFCKGYKANDKRVYSDFMSPFESLLSIGMDYQQTSKNKRFTISATLSPLALKLKYVGRPSLITYYSLNEGHHTKWEYGSNVTVNYKWNIINNVAWSGRIYYFTDYSKTQVEWENTFNLTINRYLSARLFLYPRFDDSRKRNEGRSHFEFNELLSLGLNMNF